MVSSTLWLIIGIVVVMGILGLGFLFLFWRDLKIWWYKSQYKDNFVRVMLFGENNVVVEHFSFIRSSKTVVYKNEEYVVSPKDVYHVHGIPTLFYLRGNPSPLSFANAKLNEVMVNTENLKLIIDQKLIKDLLIENNLLKIILIIGIVTLCAVVLIGFKVFDVVKLIQGAGK